MSTIKQVAALPVCRGQDGSIQVMLVTSRETRRWVLPKGWPWPGLSDAYSAAGEALEEAGIEGRVSDTSLGSYRYEKRSPDCIRQIVVDVYLLEVTREHDTWPEVGQRQRAWFTAQAAAEAVQEPELQAILTDVGVRASHRDVKPRRRSTTGRANG